MQGTVWAKWTSAPRLRRVDEVPPMLHRIGDFSREIETRKHAIVAGELCAANFVLTLEFGVNIDLTKLIGKLPLITWFMRPAAVIRLSVPRTTVLVFASGKALLVGVRSVLHGLVAAWLVALILRRHGVHGARVEAFYTRNVTSTTMMGSHVDIIELAENPPATHRSQFWSDLFPGVYFKPHDKTSKLTLSCFVSGHINITGSVNVFLAEWLINYFWRRLFHFRVTEPEECEALEARAQDERRRSKRDRAELKAAEARRLAAEAAVRKAREDAEDAEWERRLQLRELEPEKPKRRRRTKK